MPYGASGVGIQGTTTGAKSATLVVDSTATFLSENINVGTTIVNITDDSDAQVIQVVSNTQILCTGLTKGKDNVWNTGDIYRIYVDDPDVIAGTSPDPSADPNIRLTKELNIYFSVSGDVYFAVRIIDARRHSRMREYEIQRHGVDAQYKNGLGDFEKDKYTGTRDMSWKEVEEYYKENPEVTNMQLDYGPTEKRRFIYLRADESSVQTQYGRIPHGQAILAASLYHPYRRGDVIRIHDKIWEISEIPRFEYLRGKEIIGYHLEVVEAKHRQIDW